MDGPDENQIKLKKDIIQAEIIDKNYDTEKFFAFCLKKKENGDGWSESVGWLVLRGRDGGVVFGVSGNFFCEEFCVEWRDWAFDEVIFWA